MLSGERREAEVKVEAFFRNSHLHSFGQICKPFTGMAEKAEELRTFCLLLEQREEEPVMALTESIYQTCQRAWVTVK